QTSWGSTTRLIGAIIMVHGDDNGLVLPPKVAPVQVVIVPIRQQQEGVLDKANEIKEELAKKGMRFKTDDTDNIPGWKFAEAEMRGIPVRVEIGPKDIEAGKAVLARRDTGEKTECAIDDLPETIEKLLDTIQKDMLEKARSRRDSQTYTATTKEEFDRLFAERSGFVKAMWCGDVECENKIKEEMSVTSRCMPFEQEKIADTCVCCGRPAKKLVYWGRAY
ncbi:MAG: proline--tRNA ligase, partial [Lachnospiraceae bacterium]|nr:proline--tRNA ligase [Lachnospiraceae bacterium]